MKNLEIKVKVDNLDEVKGKLSFAKYEGRLEQKDTYFLVGNTKIKTREENNRNELIVYIRKMKKGTRISKYCRLPFLRTIFTVVQIILKLVFRIKVIVFKKRELYMYKHTRIHLDTVQSQGSFIELETVCDNSLVEKEYQEEHDEVIQKLNLNKYEVIGGSYADTL